MKLNDNVLNGRHLFEILNDDGSAVAVETKTTVLDNVMDSLLAEA